MTASWPQSAVDCSATSSIRASSSIVGARRVFASSPPGPSTPRIGFRRISFFFSKAFSSVLNTVLYCASVLGEGFRPVGVSPEARRA